MANPGVVNRLFQEWNWAIGIIPVGIIEWITAGEPEREALCTEMKWFERSRAGDFVADPFLVEWDDETWILFEQFKGSRGRGVIGAARLSGTDVTDMGPVMTNGRHHLAYPSVFRRFDQRYCVADSSDSRGVPLFAALGPTKWTHAGYLDGVPRLTDPTIHFDGERWWLFGLSGRQADLKLKRFVASDPLSRWIECSSLEATDRMRRPAGSLVKMGNGKTMRLAQDCRNDYGDGVCIYEVLICDIMAYAEKLVQVIVPSSNWPFREGCHTITGNSQLTIVDAYRKELHALTVVRKLRQRTAVRY
jgi:hypothetical protein